MKAINTKFVIKTNKSVKYCFSQYSIKKDLKIIETCHEDLPTKLHTNIVRKYFLAHLYESTGR